MRQIPGHALWIGNAGDLRDPRAVLDAGIAAVVELADSDQFASLPRDLIRCRFPLSDGGDNPPWLLRLAAQTVASLLQAGTPALVCCAGGMSRSVCIAAAALSLAEDLTLDGALAIVAATGPADVAPGLWAQVRDSIN